MPIYNFKQFIYIPLIVIEVDANSDTGSTWEAFDTFCEQLGVELRSRLDIYQGRSDLSFADYRKQ
jgi:phage terminase large subunit